MMHAPPTNWPVQAAGVVTAHVVENSQHAPTHGLGVQVVAPASSVEPGGQVGPVTVH